VLAHRLSQARLGRGSLEEASRTVSFTVLVPAELRPEHPAQVHNSLPHPHVVQQQLSFYVPIPPHGLETISVIEAAVGTTPPGRNEQMRVEPDGTQFFVSDPPSVDPLARPRARFLQAGTDVRISACLPLEQLIAFARTFRPLVENPPAPSG
jgi:hypothetical protein